MGVQNENRLSCSLRLNIVGVNHTYTAFLSMMDGFHEMGITRKYSNHGPDSENTLEMDVCVRVTIIALRFNYVLQYFKLLNEIGVLY